MSENPTGPQKSDEGLILFAEFLESVPPGKGRKILNLCQHEHYSIYLENPEIKAHCPSDKCNGSRIFRTPGNNTELIETGKAYDLFLEYSCSNCHGHKITFAVIAIRTNESEGICEKYGQSPNFGPKMPSRLLKLFGPDRRDFIKGRQCENQGLGIGAFAYYRRVVENQKDQIFDNIIRVAIKLDVEEEITNALEAAKKEGQFTKSLDLARDFMPESLKINGHSPLKLLHGALSDGLHIQSDECCLEIATSVRIILGELADRIYQALKDEKKVNTALSVLLEKDRQRKNGE